MSNPTNYNLRVYAIIMNSKGEILISDECRNGYSFTKFPGGGLQLGEGLGDCLKRELKEELNIEAEIGDLFYVNDFFQRSVFRETDQMISFYYGVNDYEGKIEVSDHTVSLVVEGEKFRWVSLSDLSADMMTFPIDKAVVQTLLDIEI